jgi:hypothetical protein
MKDDKHQREGQTGMPPNRHPRQDRLKQALRENLRRRKSQARGRSDATIPPSKDNDHDASPRDADGKKPDK